MPPKEPEKSRPPQVPKPLAPDFMPWANLFAEAEPSAETTWQAHLDLAALFRKDGAEMPPRTFLLQFACSQLAVLEQQVRRGAATKPGVPKPRRPPGKMFMPWASLVSGDAATEQALDAIHDLSDLFMNRGRKMSKTDLLTHISCAQLAILERV